MANERLTELYSFDGDKFTINDNVSTHIFGTIGSEDFENEDDLLKNREIQDQISKVMQLVDLYSKAQNPKNSLITHPYEFVEEYEENSSYVDSIDKDNLNPDLIHS